MQEKRLQLQRRDKKLDRLQKLKDVHIVEKISQFVAEDPERLSNKKIWQQTSNKFHRQVQIQPK